MKDFLITLCLGWLGVHRFMQKKYITGAIWFFTLGLCGIGWAADTLIALVKVANEKKPQTIQQTTQNPKNEQKFRGGVQPIGKQLVKSFDTEIVGTFANCDLNKNYTRAEVIAAIKPKSKLYLEYHDYKGEPAYYVCDSGLDAGNIPARIATILYEQYRNCEYVVSLREKAYYNSHNDLIQKIKIDIYM